MKKKTLLRIMLDVSFAALLLLRACFTAGVVWNEPTIKYTYILSASAFVLVLHAWLMRVCVERKLITKRRNVVFLLIQVILSLPWSILFLFTHSREVPMLSFYIMEAAMLLLRVSFFGQP